MMISYLCIAFLFETVHQDDPPNLTNLIRFGVTTITLQIHQLAHTLPPKDMVATLGPFNKPQTQHEPSKIIETVCLRPNDHQGFVAATSRLDG